MKTDDEVRQSFDDLEMMKRPHLWPHKSCLCLKKRALVGPPTAFGILLVPPGLRWTVHLHETGENLYYDSPEAILADGWVVD